MVGERERVERRVCGEAEPWPWPGGLAMESSAHAAAKLRPPMTYCLLYLASPAPTTDEIPGSEPPSALAVTIHLI
jgi:hypothetical protein